MISVNISGSNIWEIHDDDFVELSCWRDYCHPIFVIRDHYKHLGDSGVILQMQQYYKNMVPRTRMTRLENDRRDLSQVSYNYMEFETKYYPCIKNYVNKLNWVGK